MRRLLIFIFLLVSAGNAYCETSGLNLKPWLSNEYDVESGMIWKIGGDTTYQYRIVPFLHSWRTPQVFLWELNNGSTLVVRNKFTFMGHWFATGCENFYLGASAAPSVEWWAPGASWHLYGSAGGGVGFVDAQGLPGGQGQNFTLNWFGQLGFGRNISPAWSARAGVMFQHLSNGGQTNPNPGLNALGITFGLSRKF